MNLFAKANLQQKLEKTIIDEKKWALFQKACVFIVLGSASAVMTVINFFTGQNILGFVTLGFSVGCAIDLLLLYFGGIAARISMFLFAAEIISLFLFFIISGILDGFSVLWMVMLPSFGLLFFEVRYGSILALVMFLAQVFFFWVPFGQSLLQYDYSPTFKMRFPVFYMACFAVAFLLERMSEAAHSALRKSEKKYEYLCNHDALTKLYNRFWLQSIVADIDKLEIKPSAVAIIDIDNFKYINDSFGHPNGDVVICGMANAIGEALNQSGALCRWGGDEFLVLFHTDIDADTVCNRVIDVVRACEFDLDGKK